MIKNKLKILLNIFINCGGQNVSKARTYPKFLYCRTYRPW